jgi:hypothetical protein
VAIRALMVAKRSARAGRTQTINQAWALIVSGPDEVRARGRALCAVSARSPLTLGLVIGGRELELPESFNRPSTWSSG